MANNIKIATFNPQMFEVNDGMTYEAMTDICIDFWKARFAKVLPDKPDLIVMPECSNRPAEVLPLEKRFEYYDFSADRTLEFIANVAKENNTNIVCSQARKLDGKWYNTSTVFGRDGKELGVYSKNYLVLTEHTEERMTYCDQAELIETDFGKIACVICFDLNFDDLREKYRKLEPDLIVFSSMYHGGGQQIIWPWLCRCHFVGSMTGRTIPAEIRNPFGEILHSTTNYFDYVCGNVNLDCQIVHLDFNWEKLDALKQKYGSEVNIYDPGQYGCILVTSNSQSFTSGQMLEEFDIDNYDTYLQKSLEQRGKNIR